MKSSDFSELCISLCRSAGVPTPNLDPDTAGNTALVVSVDDVELVLSYEPSVAQTEVKIETSLGLLAPQDLTEVSHVLADICGLMRWDRTGSFVCDPQTGHAVFQYLYSLQGASGADLYARLRALAEIVQAWREDVLVNSTHALFGAESRH